MARQYKKYDRCPACGASSSHWRKEKPVVLVDLSIIEPIRGTCHNFGGEEGTNGEYYDFFCSACGFCCGVCEPSYCPNCGAKVVDE